MDVHSRFLEAAKQGRNWEERNAVAELTGWEQTLDLIRSTLPQSRHAEGWDDNMLVFLPEAYVMGTIVDRPPAGLPVVGGNPESRGWMGQLQRSGSQTLLPLLLATQTSANVPGDATLQELLSDPAYNLR